VCVVCESVCVVCARDCICVCFGLCLIYSLSSSIKLI